MVNPLEELNSEMARALSGLSASESQARPVHRSNAWSIQQVVEHLLLTYTLSTAAIEERLAKGTPTRKPPTLKHRIVQFFVLELSYFPRREAPMNVRPVSNPTPRSGPELAAAVTAALSTLDSVLNRAEEMFGDARCMTHGILGPLSSRQWRMFQLVHGRHHIRQIIAIKTQH